MNNKKAWRHWRLINVEDLYFKCIQHYYWISGSALRRKNIRMFSIVRSRSLLLGRIDLNPYTRRRRWMPHIALYYREINESESIPYVYNIDTFSMKIILHFQWLRLPQLRELPKRCSFYAPLSLINRLLTTDIVTSCELWLGTMCRDEVKQSSPNGSSVPDVFLCNINFIRFI